MFNSDKPITNQKSDCLNRRDFSKQLAKAIISYTNEDNFTMSLCGKWGSGKTSVLNMVVEEIRSLTNDLEKYKKPIIITFNPWNYSSQAQLITQFFHVVLDALGKNNNLKKVYKSLKKYSSLLEYSAYIPVVGKYLKPLIGTAKDLSKQNSNDKDNLEKIKKSVIKALKDQKQKLIVIIDDIDRLNNEQIRSIFQLVNSLAGFPNMIYLLSFDKEIVARALEKEQNCKGEEYLEKIIQVPFEIPKARKSSIIDVLCEKFKNIVFNDKVKDETFKEDYWRFVLTNCIFPYLDSIRDVNRVINAFEFKYGLMKEEINCIDLLAITTLQICATPIYEWIYNNSSHLVSKKHDQNGASYTEYRQNEEYYLKIFQGIHNEDPKSMLRTIQVLFPKFSYITGGYLNSNYTIEELNRDFRISSEDRIDRYFNLSLEDIAIKKDQIFESIQCYSPAELKNYFQNLLDNDILRDYLYELMAYIPDIPKERISIFIDELVEMQTVEKNFQSGINDLSIKTSYICDNCMCKIFAQNTKQQNMQIIKEQIEKMDVKKAPIVCNIIEKIEHAYGKMGTHENINNNFVDLDDLNSLESLVLNRLKTLSADECLLDSKLFYYVRGLWEYLDESGYDDYIANSLKDSVNIPKYLYNIVDVLPNGKTNGWRFKEEKFVKYISAEKVYDEVSKLKDTPEFDKLDRSFQEMAVAYFLWYNLGNKDTDVSKEDVYNKISEWE